MKPLALFVLLALASPILHAQEPETSQPETGANPAGETVTKKPIGERYIRDYLYVPLRSGQSAGHRVVHRGLKSGTVVTVMETNEDSGYSLVVSPGGTEGWIPTQYLMTDIPNSIKLAKANATIEQLSKKAGPISEQLLDAKKENDDLKQKLETLGQNNNQLNAELDRIKELSSKELELNEMNKKIIQENNQLANQRDTLKAENQSLKERIKKDNFIDGAIAVILGIIATLIIQSINNSRRRSSEWA